MAEMTGTLSQRIMRGLLAVLLSVAGIAHLTFARSEFAELVPGWLPLPADFVVIASGIVEIAFGLALAAWGRARRTVCIVLAGFFLVVWLGNIHQYVSANDAFGLATAQARAVRVALQPLLIAAALWAGGVFTRADTNSAA